MPYVMRQADLPTSPSVNEVWAYRARSVDELVPVRVLRQGANTPPRVLIRFEDPDEEAQEQWVPPARLKVRWTEVDAFRAEEARWNAVYDLSPSQQSAEVHAAEQAFNLLVDMSVAEFRSSHLVVRDPDALAVLADVDVSVLSSHPAGFMVDDHGPLIVPWPVALEVVRSVIVHNPDPVLAQVAQEEATARYEAIHGHRSSAGGSGGTFHLSAEQCVETDREPFAGPKRAHLRRWAGQAADRWDELIELRKEIKRVGDVAEDAIDLLRQRGHRRDADRLLTQLGMTVEMLHHDA